MKMNVLFDAGTTSEAFKNCVYAARDFICSRFVGGNQINIQAGLGTLGGSPLSTLGSSLYFQTTAFTYSQVRTAIQNKALTANALAAFNANWPVSDPTGGPGTSWTTNVALQKTLGLVPTDAFTDGFFGLGNGFTFDFKPDNTTTPPGGSFKAFSVIVHEITEIMGRTLGNLPMLMCSYSASGVREFTSAANPHYFSINNGTINLRSWNQNPAGDGGDWAGAGGAQGDSLNAFTSSGILAPFDSIDDINMDVIGYGFIPNINPANVAVSGSGKGRGGF